MKRLDEIEARLSAVEAEIGGRSFEEFKQDHDRVAVCAPADLRYLLDFAKAAREALAIAKPFLGEVMTWAPYEVAGWHLNGALEPLENWINENGGPEAHDAVSKALALLESP